MLSITPDNTATYSISQSAAGSWQGAFTITGNLNLFLVGVVSMTADPTSITCNGVALTKLATVSSPGSTYTTRASLWALQNAPVGPSTIRVYWSGTWSGRFLFRSFSNVHAYTPLGTPQSYGGNILTTTFTFPESVNQGYSFHIGGFGGSGTKTIAAGETSLLNGSDTYGATVISCMCGEKATTGANASLSFSSNLARDFAHVGVIIKPFPGGRSFRIVNSS
jgi:hypothetical protein